MSLGDRQCDRQTESGSAALAPARGVAPGEALEDPGSQFVADPRPLIRDGQERLAVAEAGLDVDGPARGCVADRVLHQADRGLGDAVRTAGEGGQLALRAGADVPATLAALRALPGIGDWTAQYIALRALRWPDAFPGGDVALQKALGLTGQPHGARAAEALAERWRPWRGYAVVRGWQSLSDSLSIQ